MRTIYLLPALLVLALGGLWASNRFVDRAFDRFSANVEYGASLTHRMQLLELDADVLFLGDSRTQQGMIPRLFEEKVASQGDISALNLGRPGMQAPFFFYTLENYLNNTDNRPDVIFLNVSYYLLYGSKWMERIYLVGFQPTFNQAYDAASSGLMSPWASASWYIRTRVPVLKYNKPFHNEVLPLVIENPTELGSMMTHHHILEDTFYGNDTKGYLSRGYTHIAPNDRTPGRGSAGHENPLYLSYLERFFALAEENGIKVIVYEFPWPEAQRSARDEAAIKYYANLVKDRAERFEKVSVVEHDYFWPHIYFVNPLHLNEVGAQGLTSIAVDWYVDAVERSPSN